LNEFNVTEIVNRDLKTRHEKNQPTNNESIFCLNYSNVPNTK
jgi:hypothetical protein